MSVIMITEDNIEEYERNLPADMADDIGRSNYYGLAVHDEEGEVSASAIWRLKDYEVESKDTKSYISWIQAADADSGEALLNEYDNMMDVAGTKRSFAEFPEEGNEELIDILKDSDFDMSEKEGRDLVVTVGQLAKLNVAKKTKVPSYLQKLDSMMTRTFRRGIMNCIFHSPRELLEDLPTLPMSWFEPEISCCVESDGKVNGVLLIHKLPSGRLRVECLNAFGPDSRRDLMYMIRFSIHQAVKLYPEDTEVILPRRDESARLLTKYFFPNAVGDKCYYGERDETIRAML